MKNCIKKYTQTAVYVCASVWACFGIFSVAYTEIQIGMNAGGVLGQQDFISNSAGFGAGELDSPYATALDSDNHRLFVADTDNNRVLVYDLEDDNYPIDTTGCVFECGSFTTVPTYVIGQPNMFTVSAGTTQSKLSAPRGLYYHAETSRLFVAEFGNNRVTVFDVSTSTMADGISASSVIGQVSFTIGTGATSQTRMNQPVGLAYDEEDDRLFVSQVSSNRVTVYDAENILTTSTPAIYVLGQGLFTGATPATTQAGMSSPRMITYDQENDRLFVAQFGNHRVTVYAVATSTISNGMSASHVLGQTTFTAGSSALSQSRMAGPVGLAYDEGADRLFVSEFTNHRVTVYAVATSTISNGMSASHVLGQTEFGVNTSAATQSKFANPLGIMFDEVANRLYVSEQSNNRVTFFNFDPTIPYNPTVSSVTTSTIQFGWNAVPSATYYTVSSSVGVVTTTDVSYVFDTLTPSTTYALQVQANDTTTSSVFSAVFTTTTLRVPIISEVEVGEITSSSARISWNTNKQTSSQIYYGLSASLGVTTTENNIDTRVLEHEITLTNLLACTVYQFTPRVEDVEGNSATTTMSTVTTTGCLFESQVLSYESNMVATSTGGTIELAIDDVQEVVLTVPSGFSEEEEGITFQVKQIETQPVSEGSVLPSGKQIIGDLMFDFRAVSGSSTIISSFDEIVSVQMAYEESDVTDENTLSIYRYTGGAWTELSSCVTNQTENTVTCETTGFSLFALFGSTGSEGVSSIRGGGVSVLNIPPSPLSRVVINDGLPSTNSRTVKVQIFSPDAKWVAISEDNTFSGVSFIPIVDELLFTLSEEVGEKIVYVKFRTDEGGERVVVNSIVFGVEECPVKSGYVYKSPQSAAVYLVTPHCTKRLFLNEEVFFSHVTSWDEVLVVKEEVLAGIAFDTRDTVLWGARHQVRYGALVKTPHNPEVFVIIAGKKHWIASGEIFEQLGYEWSWIEDVEDELLRTFETGSDILRLDRLPSYVLIKYPNQSPVYRLETISGDVEMQHKRWIPNERTFFDLGFGFGRIMTIPVTISFLDGPPLTEK